MQRQFELVAGPMAGMAHELYGNIMPEEIGLFHPDDEREEKIHWYVLRDGKGYYSRTEMAKKKKGR